MCGDPISHSNITGRHALLACAFFRKGPAGQVYPKGGQINRIRWAPETQFFREAILGTRGRGTPKQLVGCNLSCVGGVSRPRAIGPGQHRTTGQCPPWRRTGNFAEGHARPRGGSFPSAAGHPMRFVDRWCGVAVHRECCIPYRPALARPKARFDRCLCSGCGAD
jgi:hypothetical protein